MANEKQMQATKARKKKRKKSTLASLYGDPNKITRGDIIAAAIKKNKK
tara:strand:- start:472 stop:615 length:144 start_codon:yes stop_codon:yes gene_type:complete